MKKANQYQRYKIKKTKLKKEICQKCDRKMT